MTEAIQNHTEYVSTAEVADFIQELDLDLKVRVSALQIAAHVLEQPIKVDILIATAARIEEYLIQGLPDSLQKNFDSEQHSG